MKTELSLLIIVFACVEVALGGIGTLKVNWVENKCGFDPSNTGLDQRFAQIHLDYVNTVTSGTTYTISSLTLNPQGGAPSCLINNGGTWQNFVPLAGAQAAGPIDVNISWKKKLHSLKIIHRFAAIGLMPLKPLKAPQQSTLKYFTPMAQMYNLVVQLVAPLSARLPPLVSLVINLISFSLQLFFICSFFRSSSFSC